MFASLSLPILLLIFIGAAAFVWVAGVRLSDTTDVLSFRFGLGVLVLDAVGIAGLVAVALGGS